MTPDPAERAAALVRVNPRVLSLVHGDHGQVFARVSYEQSPGRGGAALVVEETVTLARGIGDGDSLSPRELARDAVSRTLCEAWTLHAPDGRAIEVGPRPLVVGVLNVTPDSFSDGGLWLEPEAAVAQGLEMIAAGADWIDIGGESTRPGSASVTDDEERRRVVPVIEALARRTAAPISVDTSKATVAEAALEAGASILNDVSALRGDPRLAEVAAAAGAPLVLMHMQGTPGDMQDAPAYEDVVLDVARFLREAVAGAVAAGVPEAQTVIDPGIGFGKTVDHNLEIVRRLLELRSLGRPILVGLSRKSFLGKVLDLEVGDRTQASVVGAALALERGATLVRVHDVIETVRAIRLINAVREGWGTPGAHVE